MKQNLFKSIILIIVMAFASFVYFPGCTNEVSPSLYSGTPTDPSGTTPKITSVNPASAALAHVDLITIKGENFLTDTSAVKVYFGKQAGKVLQASQTQLTVLSPNISGNLKIKISTNVAELFSNTYDYYLEAAAVDRYPDVKDKTNIPVCIAIDKNDNLYTSNSSIGVVQITPDSVTSLYSPKGGETFWAGMRFGPGGDLYAARGLQAVFYIPAGGGVKNSPWVVLSPSSIKLSHIEFDPMGNLWASGKNSDIYRIKPDKSYTSFPFDYNVTAMRIFKDGGSTYIYLAAQQDSMTTIMRIPIDANGDPGSPETYFNFSANYGSGYVINDLTFAADGEMFLATNLPSPIVYVNPDKSSGILYPDIILKSPALSFAWGSGNYLYYVRSQINDASGAMVLPQSIVRLNVQKPSAPYYGM
jgi:hypothetical protein